MQKLTWLGVGTVLLSALYGCSSGDSAPGSRISQAKGGSGGTGAEAGSLSLGISGGGTGGSGTGGDGNASGGSSGGVTLGGTSAGGVTSHAGSSTGGTGGTKPTTTCKRAAGSDADCADFYPAAAGEPARPQAYSCTDTGAYLTLNTAHGSKCASVSFVTGAKYGACCPP